MALAIETTALTKRFGNVPVLRNVALNVPTGCVYGFLGPNGAGKSTLMRALLGLIAPDSGSIRLLGFDLMSKRQDALRHVGAFVEQPSLYDHLSGSGNLELTRMMLGLPRSEVGRALAVVGLERAARQRVADYSLGMRQRLAIGRAILGTPKLLLLDEPTNGLDPDGIEAMRNLIRELPDRIGGTVFVSSHLLSEIEQTATMAGLMQAGELVLQERVQTLIGGSDILRIEIDDPERGVTMLSATGVEVASVDRNVVRLRLPNQGDIEELTAKVNHQLVEAGLRVSALYRETRTLEQVYRDAIAGRMRAAA